MQPDAACAEPDRLAVISAELAERPYVRRGVTMSAEPIRVVLADDHTVVRAGLRALLRASPDISVVGEASSGPEAVDAAVRLRPNVVVMDLDMPGGDGATATRELARRDAAIRVLVLSHHSEEESLVALFDAGACGFLAKDAADRELVDAIRVVASGDVYVRPRVARVLAAHLHHRAAQDEPSDEQRRRVDALSERERAVFSRVAEGFNGREIASQLGISPKTVDTYRQRIEEKIGVRHRTEYVRLALTLGMLRAEAHSGGRR
jgi:DNA-binding NarL/FixJ family response regulator